MEVGRRNGKKNKYFFHLSWRQLFERASTTPNFEVVLSAQTADTDGNTWERGDGRKRRLVETQLLGRWRWAFEEMSAFLSLPIPLQQCWRKQWQPNISFSLGVKPAARKMWLPFSFGSSLLWWGILVALVTLPVVLSFGSVTSVASHSA